MLGKVRQYIKQPLSSLLLLSHVFMAWKALSILTLSSHPVHVIISASMEPAFQRGDIIFIWNRTEVISVGDIPVIWFENYPLPMTHRAIKVLWEPSRDGHHCEYAQT